jgi:hypothetical protein
LIRWSTINIGENVAISTNGVGKTIFTCRRLKLDPYLSPSMNINSKKIKNVNVRPGPKTLKLTQERIRKTLEHIGIGNNFFTRTPIAQ